MGRRGRKKGVFQDVSGGPSWERTSNSPVGYVHSSRGQKQGQLRERRERLAYDTRLAKTFFTIVGAAVLAFLLWLDHKGY